MGQKCNLTSRILMDPAPQQSLWYSQLSVFSSTSANQCTRRYSLSAIRTLLCRGILRSADQGNVDWQDVLFTSCARLGTFTTFLSHHSEYPLDSISNCATFFSPPHPRHFITQLTFNYPFAHTLKTPLNKPQIHSGVTIERSLV